MRILYSDIYNNKIKFININGVNSKFTIEEKKEEIYKLTYLSFFLNPKETQNEKNKEINKIKSKGKEGKVLNKYKNKFIDNLSIDIQKYKETPFLYKEFCLKFKEKGYYSIDLFSNNNWPKNICPSHTKAFRFFVNFEKDGMTKCIEHLFKEINEEELNIIKNLRKDIEITTIKVKNFGEGEEGKMIIVDLYLRMMTERIFHIKPYLMKKRLNILIQIIMMKKIKRRKR